VLDAASQPAFRLRPASAAAHEALSVLDLEDREWCTIHGATRTLQPAMRLTREGHPLAQVRKVVISPLSERYEVDLASGDRLSAKGDLNAFEFVIHRGRRVVASVSRSGVPRPEVLGVQIAPSEDGTLLLAVTVCMYLMSEHAGR
jgi:uncharacterized protein YxjI